MVVFLMNWAAAKAVPWEVLLFVWRRVMFWPVKIQSSGLAGVDWGSRQCGSMSFPILLTLVILSFGILFADRIDQ